MIEFNNKTKSNIDLVLLSRVVERFFDYYKIKNKELSVAFIGDEEMKKLNRDYRGKNSPTDILSFEGEEDDLGEIVIDYAQIERQAPEFSRSVEEELIFIFVHGLLHLLGYTDETEEKRLEMIRLGEVFIKTLSSKF